MQGYESTVFAYGQTGTGKTYTMEGDLTSADQHGIIPRAALAIFEVLKKPEITSSAIFCSYLEIYNEDLGDLLADESQSSMGGKNTKLEIMDSKEGTFCR
jgi:kinesin family protein 11